MLIKYKTKYEITRTTMKAFKNFFAILLIIASLLTVLTSCKGSRIDKYKEDTSTEKKEKYHVAMDVGDYGIIIVELDRTAAPITVDNFIKLVRADFYNGLTFHRVLQNFMIQGGDPLANGNGGSDEEIYGEFIENGYYNPISHERGVISMARSKDPDSASSQFFICNADAFSLDGSYAAFGHVVEGMDTVDKITSSTAKYGDYNGTINNKSYQAVIREMRVIIYNP